MINQFSTADEVRRGYHSGLSGKVIDVKAAKELEANRTPQTRVEFVTGKYRPPAVITVRSSIDNDWKDDRTGSFVGDRWVFTFDNAPDFEMKFVLNQTFWMSGGNISIKSGEPEHTFHEPAISFAYELSFQTEKWQPNHLVTLRNSRDGWRRDVYGVFRGDTWKFLLDLSNYDPGFEAKFFLDRSIPMDEDVIEINHGQYYNYDDKKVSFPAEPSQFRHGYDNFSTVEWPIEQSIVSTRGQDDEEYDTVIVGSGIAGGILGDALSERGKRVLILEAGGVRLPVHQDQLPRGEQSLVGRDELVHFDRSGTADFQKGAIFSLGGRSPYWSGLIPRMQDYEFREPWPDAVKQALTTAESSQPSRYDQAEQTLKKGVTLGAFQRRILDHLCKELPDYDVEELPRSYHQPNIDSQGVMQNLLRRANGVFSSSDLLLESLGFSELNGNHNLRINLHQLATRIEHTDGRATAVVCQDLVGGVERHYRGKNIVLACGSVESAKLALNSQLDDPKKRIGRGLTDHPTYFYKVDHVLPQTGPFGWIGNPTGHAKVMLRHKDAAPGVHPYNIELLINPRYWDTRFVDDNLWQSRVDPGGDSKVEIKFIFDSPLNNKNFVRSNGIGRKPEVSVARNETAACYKEGLLPVRDEILTKLGVPECDLSKTWVPKQWDEGVNGSVHHAGGTLRMAKDGRGVVDENLAFLAYENLYCCDASVFASIPAANPSLTVAALSLRLADHLSP
ncbi:GMC oxidoreductase [Thalassoglobus sp. JC818]|uniref:GMC oxidoreductase n=1 Tax=Thalassoglobus sp. JC818 TaxID=3232136 RepID=UPI00345AD792